MHLRRVAVAGGLSSKEEPAFHVLGHLQQIMTSRAQLHVHKRRLLRLIDAVCPVHPRCAQLSNMQSPRTYRHCQTCHLYRAKCLSHDIFMCVSKSE
jgi:hypothetical protein